MGLARNSKIAKTTPLTPGSGIGSTIYPTRAVRLTFSAALRRPQLSDMAAIPNLLTGLRGGSRGRGRGRGQANIPGFSDASSINPATRFPRSEQAIRATDTDAAVSRLSAVCAGYLEDPFAEHFVEAASATRRLPIINRGTYTRTSAIDRLVDLFLAGSGERQIVSLGAGTDTRAFRLRARGERVLYHEFDFPDICAVKKSRVDAGAIVKLIDKQDGLTDYHIHSLDLRTIAGKEATDFEGLRINIPTLVISECCLCYLKVEITEEVIQWFIKRMPSLSIILYEPIRVDDPFGQQMVENLASRGVVMPTVQKYRTLKDQEERLAKLAFVGVSSESTDKIWDRWIDEDEKERVNALEGLDEVEEWNLLASHYAVIWGWTDESIFQK
ncbi:S-adenosyl-L-methionine-dependent methyltransferase [Calycina marina]|uniref:Leucine carboxyl methyltransferase 1 n=1 Tax=Calycina marina TaxID=1763456 RepID=A0A9P7ZBR5_9HELO|nr:S-adenosyl-L-methionine-dependent methyltransferase [Calycina marina]